MERRYIKGFKHIFLYSGNKNNHRIFLLFPQDSCSINAIHTLHLNIEEYNVCLLSLCQKFLSCFIGFYIAVRRISYGQFFDLLPDYFFIIYDCYLHKFHTSNPDKSYILCHLFYRQKKKFLPRNGTKPL